MFVHMGKQQDTGEPAFPKKGRRFWPLSKFRALAAHAFVLNELTYMRVQQSHELVLINNSMTLGPLHLHRPRVQSLFHSMHMERSGLSTIVIRRWIHVRIQRGEQGSRPSWKITKI